MPRGRGRRAPAQQRQRQPYQLRNRVPNDQQDRPRGNRRRQNVPAPVLDNNAPLQANAPEVHHAPFAVHVADPAQHVQPPVQPVPNNHTVHVPRHGGDQNQNNAVHIQQAGNTSNINARIEHTETCNDPLLFPGFSNELDIFYISISER